MSFLRVFQSVLHALEAAATIAAPIIKAVDPEIGALMAAAVSTAVVVEGAVTVPGPQKAAIVSQVSNAGIELTNQLLVSQGKKPLASNIQGSIDAAVKIVIDQMNAVANQVQPAAPLAVAASK